MKPCIAIDISKGKSYYQGFISLNEPFTKTKSIHHDKVGYDELISVGMTMKEKYGDIDYVFESTGIYHKGLQNRLETEKQKYIILNPLEAAKIRKSKLRSTKTDKKDCQSIALAYYTREHKPHNKKDKLHETLQIMNREYKFLIQMLRQMKVRFITIHIPKFQWYY
jgi:transposase